MNLLLVVGVGFFLLTVGALLGRYYVPDRRPLKRAAEEGRAYVRGLVEVLEGDDDGAIDEIASALRRNTKTVEAYFALGALFRKRGEHERAVRVHQSLLVRRDVDKKTRLRVHHQLALDFKAAGFPRRATKALEFVIAKDRKAVPAFEELAKLYEETGQWERSAAVQRRLAKLTGSARGAVLAHLFAQHAQDAIERAELRVARKALRRALSADASSVHALDVLAQLQLRQGNRQAATKAWFKALRLDPELASFFVPRLESELFELERLPELDKVLTELLDKQPDNVHLRLANARRQARHSPQLALALLTGLLEEHPALLPARREAARLTLAEDDPVLIRAAFEDMLGMLDRADRGFRCRSCGHAAAELFWHCPSCRSWDSVGVAWGRRAGESATRAKRDSVKRKSA